MPFPSPNQQCQSMEGVSDVFIFLIIKMSGHIVNHELCCTSKYLFSSEWQSSNSITLRLYNVQHKTTFLGDSAAKIKTVNQFILTGNGHKRALQLLLRRRWPAGAASGFFGAVAWNMLTHWKHCNKDACQLRTLCRRQLSHYPQVWWRFGTVIHLARLVSGWACY